MSELQSKNLVAPDTKSEILTTALARLAADRSFSVYTAVANVFRELSPEDTGLVPARIAILSNFTMDAMVPVIEGEVALSGFHPLIYQAGFDTVAQESLAASSGLYSFRPDFIVLAEWLEPLAPELSTRFLSLSPEKVGGEIERVLAYLREILSAIRCHSSAPVLLNNFPLPAYPTLGILDAQSDSCQTGSILKLNQGLQRLARESNDVYLVDYMGLTARIGSAQAIDDRYWHIGRAPIGRSALVAFGGEYARFVRALRGKARKCLVLDCDNTLWGGIIGEDGMGGIKLGSAYPGSMLSGLSA